MEIFSIYLNRRVFVMDRKSGGSSILNFFPGYIFHAQVNTDENPSLSNACFET